MFCVSFTQRGNLCGVHDHVARNINEFGFVRCYNDEVIACSPWRDTHFFVVYIVGITTSVMFAQDVPDVPTLQMQTTSKLNKNTIL